MTYCDTAGRENTKRAAYETARQTTLNKRVTLTGIGVHSGKPATLILNPSKAGSGITFLRTAEDGKIDQLIPAHIKNVGDTRLCTILGDPKGMFVATVEHLLAALRGMNVDNVLIEIDGPEVPVMDGSSAAFVKAIRTVGLKTLAAPRRYIRILRPVEVKNGDSTAVLLPHNGTRFDVEIDFTSTAIGRQRFIVEMTPDNFDRDISTARTFGFLAEAKQLRAAGLAQGSSLENSVVIDDDDKIINEDGLRFDDEFVRHKLLDAIGDLALAGAQILGEYRSVRGGHKLNAMMLEALFANPDCWCFEDAELVEEVISIGAPIGLETSQQPVAAAKA